MYLGLHVNLPIFLLYCNKISSYSMEFNVRLQHHTSISLKSVQWTSTWKALHAGRWTDMTKVKDIFRVHTNAPKTIRINSVRRRHPKNKISRPFYTKICVFLEGVVSNTSTTASSVALFINWWTGRDVEGSERVVNWCCILTFVRRNWGHSWKFSD